MALFELASARLSARPQAPSFPSYGCSWPNLLLEAAGKLCVSRRLNWCWILLLAPGPGLVSPAPQRWEGGHPLGLLLPPEKHWPRAQPAYCYLLVLLSSELSSPGGLSLSCCVKMEPQQWFWCCWAVGLTGFGSSLLHCVYRKCCGRHLCDAVCGFNEGTALGLILIHKWAVCCGSPDMQEAHCLHLWLSCIFCIMAFTKEKHLSCNRSILSGYIYYLYLFNIQALSLNCYGLFSFFFPNFFCLEEEVASSISP